MQRTRIFLGAIAVVLGAAFAPAALAQGKGEIIKIQDYPGIGNMLFRIAISKGYCDKHGINCQLQMIPSGPLGAQALLAKMIDVGFLPPEVQINAMMRQGAPLKAILGGAVLNVYLIALRHDLITRNSDKGYPAIMADLKGRKIGVPARTSGAEIHFILMAQKVGLKAEDFTFVAVGSPNTAYGALISKQVDANMSFEPSGALCDVLKTCKTIYRGSESREPAELHATNGAAANLVVAQELIDRSAHVVEALIGAARDAEAFIQEPGNFSEALAIAQSYFKFEMAKGDEVMAAALKTGIPGYKVSISRSALKAITDNMLATKQIAEPFDSRRLVYERAP